MWVRFMSFLMWTTLIGALKMSVRFSWISIPGGIDQAQSFFSDFQSWLLFKNQPILFFSKVYLDHAQWLWCVYYILGFDELLVGFASLASSLITMDWCPILIRALFITADQQSEFCFSELGSFFRCEELVLMLWFNIAFWVVILLPPSESSRHFYIFIVEHYFCWYPLRRYYSCDV